MYRFVLHKFIQVLMSGSRVSYNNMFFFHSVWWGRYNTRIYEYEFTNTRIYGYTNFFQVNTTVKKWKTTSIIRKNTHKKKLQFDKIKTSISIKNNANNEIKLILYIIVPTFYVSNDPKIFKISSLIRLMTSTSNPDNWSKSFHSSSLSYHHNRCTFIHKKIRRKIRLNHGTLSIKILWHGSWFELMDLT